MCAEHKQDTLRGWAAHDASSPLVQEDLPLNSWNEDFVEMDVTHCSLCASDMHFIKSSWFPVEYPLVAGHEFTGIVTRVGRNVTHVKVGDRAGAGPLCHSCNHCSNCLAGDQNICEERTRNTYGDRLPNGEKTYGGFADKWRGDRRWVFKIPERLTNAEASSFLCAGITAFTPLHRWSVGPTSTVGVMGVGGIGHFGILFAKAMGAKVVALSAGDRKREVALQLGCDDYLNTNNPDDFTRYKNKFTHILCTGTSDDFSWERYFDIMRANGVFMNVSCPTWNFPELNPLSAIMHQVVISGSASGAPAHFKIMFDFADKHNIKPWIQMYKMNDINKAIEDFEAGKARFRIVLEN